MDVAEKVNVGGAAAVAPVLDEILLEDDLELVPLSHDDQLRSHTQQRSHSGLLKGQYPQALWSILLDGKLLQIFGFFLLPALAMHQITLI